MSALILRYRLNEGVSAADFERWVAEIDHPAMRGLRRVKRFETYRVVGLLMGAGAPSSDYVEIFDIDDLPGFTSEDMAGETVQAIMGSFMGFADAPEFLIAEAVDPSP
jgi:REDY-like protein HapK